MNGVSQLRASLEGALASKRPATVPRLGLIGIRERATMLGGTLEVESAPGRGTTVFVRIPIDSPVTTGEFAFDGRAGASSAQQGVQRDD